jgi:hypothetical protein
VYDGTSSHLKLEIVHKDEPKAEDENQESKEAAAEVKEGKAEKSAAATDGGNAEKSEAAKTGKKSKQAAKKSKFNKEEEAKREDRFLYKGVLYEIAPKEKAILEKQQHTLSPEQFDKLFKDFELKRASY